MVEARSGGDAEGGCTEGACAVHACSRAPSGGCGPSLGKVNGTPDNPMSHSSPCCPPPEDSLGLHKPQSTLCQFAAALACRHGTITPNGRETHPRRQVRTLSPRSSSHGSIEPMSRHRLPLPLSHQTPEPCMHTFDAVLVVLCRGRRRAGKLCLHVSTGGAGGRCRSQSRQTGPARRRRGRIRAVLVLCEAARGVG